jgi:hypothetical protein
MAITTGAELATAAANWLARADLTSRIPEFVALAEAKLNRSLRTRDMETKNATFSITGEYVAVPAGFLETKSFYLNTNPKKSLSYLPDDAQTDAYGAGTGTPRFFCVVGGNFRFAKVPDATYSSTLTYYTALTSVSAGGSAVNWLLTSHPDVYLYGTLLEAAPYLQDPATAGQWAAAYQAVMEDLRASDMRSRWGNGMAVRAG